MQGPNWTLGIFWSNFVDRDVIVGLLDDNIGSFLPNVSEFVLTPDTNITHQDTVSRLRRSTFLLPNMRMNEITNVYHVSK